MECREARELLDSFLAEELLVETNHDLLRHLAGCPACKAELDDRARIRTGLKQAFAGADELRMRPEFNAELVDALQRRASSRSAWNDAVGWLALAASLILVAGGAFYLLAGRRASETARLAAGDHQNCAVTFALSERPIPLTDAAARYDPAYAALQTSPPDQVQTDAGMLRVADRHSCVFGGRRFGHVVYRLDRQVVSVLMTDADSSGTSDRPDAGPSWLSPIDGLSMASIRTPGHVVFIVSALPDAPFRQVARALTDPVSRLAAAAVSGAAVQATACVNGFSSALRP